MKEILLCRYIYLKEILTKKKIERDFSKKKYIFERDSWGMNTHVAEFSTIILYTLYVPLDTFLTRMHSLYYLEEGWILTLQACITIVYAMSNYFSNHHYSIRSMLYSSTSHSTLCWPPVPNSSCFWSTKTWPTRQKGHVHGSLLPSTTND